MTPPNTTPLTCPLTYTSYSIPFPLTNPLKYPNPMTNIPDDNPSERPGGTPSPDRLPARSRQGVPVSRHPTFNNSHQQIVSFSCRFTKYLLILMTKGVKLMAT